MHLGVLEHLEVLVHTWHLRVLVHLEVLVHPWHLGDLEHLGMDLMHLVPTQVMLIEVEVFVHP